MCRPYSPPSRLVVFHSLFIHFNSRWSMMILYRDIRSISPGYLTFRMSTFSSLVFLFLSRSHCWTSQTPTAQPTVRPHSSIRKTRGSTRRGWRPSWSRAGWMSELLSLSALYSTLLSITHSSPSKYFSLSFLPHREKKSRKKKTQQLYQKNLSATLGGGGGKNNQTRMDITLLANAF